MKSNTNPEAQKILDIILENIQEIMGANLIALYLDGSLVIGDFDLKQSDIDLVAVLSNQMDDNEFSKLKSMHELIVVDYPEWDDRIEVCYITANALAKVKSTTSSIANISPGEPFHRLESSKKWIMNWYLTREKGITLFGPSPKTIIEPISLTEFIESVRNHVSSWDEWAKNMSKNTYAQSYARLSLCRALYSIRIGDQVSKIQAANWVMNELPKWSSVIREALVWREGPKHSPPDEKAYLDTIQFVEYVRKLILEKK